MSPKIEKKDLKKKSNHNLKLSIGESDTGRSVLADKIKKRQNLLKPRLCVDEKVFFEPEGVNITTTRNSPENMKKNDFPCSSLQTSPRSSPLAVQRAKGLLRDQKAIEGLSPLIKRLNISGQVLNEVQEQKSELFVFNQIKLHERKIKVSPQKESVNMLSPLTKTSSNVLAKDMPSRDTRFWIPN